jgi:transcriptional regulator with XRE-family HTH domain
MDAATLLRTARRRAGLSQREVARRAAIPQPAVSRIERGLVSPRVVTLEKLLEACEMELEAVSRPVGDVDRTLIWERLKLKPGQRVRAAEQEWRQAERFRRAARVRVG